MSDQGAIAEVTKALEGLLAAAVLLDDVVVDGRVVSFPPDQVRKHHQNGNVLNLFLYRTSIDGAWRNEDPPGTKPGETGFPPLALVLSYVLTAYGADDDEVLAHRLLGLAMRTLHDTPVMSSALLAAPGLGSGVDAQAEHIRITPGPIPQDELSRMWSTFGTGYRISSTYDVSPVLIDSRRATVSPVPVLTRGAGDTGPQVTGTLAPIAPLATAMSGTPVRPDAGDDFKLRLRLTGSHLAGVTSLVIDGPPLRKPLKVTPAAATDDAVEAEITANTLPAGTFGIVAESSQLDVNSPVVPFAVAPVIVNKSPVKAQNVEKSSTEAVATVQLTCSPRTVAGQTIAIIVGKQSFPGTASSKNRAKLTFKVEGLAKGSYPMRLRVDGQDSLLVVDGRPTFHRLELR